MESVQNVSFINMNESWTIRTRRRMKELGLTQKDLIDVLQVKTRGAIGHYLSGRRVMSADQLAALANKLECTTDYLLYGEENVSKNNNKSKLPFAIAEPPPEYFTKNLQNIDKYIEITKEVMLFAKDLLAEYDKPISPEKEVAFTILLLRSHLEGRKLSKDEVMDLLTLAA